MSDQVFGNKREAVISTGTRNTQLPQHHLRRWHTTTFRWLWVYAAIFSVSFMVLLGFLEYSVTTAIEREADDGIHWQLRYFDSKSDAELGAVIDARLAHEHRHANYYGLFAPDGERIVGDIPTIPLGLPFDHAGDPHSQAKGRTLLLTPHGPTVRAICERRDDGRLLVITQSLANARHFRNELTKTLIGGSILCVTASVVASLLLSIRQLRRVEETRRVTTRVARGEIALRLPIGGKDELDMLAHLVNHMLDEVERLMNEVKSTCDGIAHDLHTPLMRLRLQLVELAERVNASADEPATVLVDEARVAADVILDRFNAMLRVSEIDTLKRRSGFAAVSLETLCAQLYEMYEPVAEQKAVCLQSRVEAVELIHADRGLLFEAFSNLLDNAIKFAPLGGEVSIELKSSRLGPQLAITDNGPGIPVNERAAVLNRFYRVERTRHLPGVGLGLGIVSAIVRLHDFSLRIGGEFQGTIITVDCWSQSLQQAEGQVVSH